MTSSEEPPFARALSPHAVVYLFSATMGLAIAGKAVRLALINGWFADTGWFANGRLPSIVVAAVAGGSALWLLYLVGVQWLTTISPEGIDRRGAFGRTWFPWEVVRRSDERWTRFARYLVIESDSDRLKLEVRYFRDPEAVIRFVRRHTESAS